MENKKILDNDDMAKIARIISKAIMGELKTNGEVYDETKKQNLSEHALRVLAVERMSALAIQTKNDLLKKAGQKNE